MSELNLDEIRTMFRAGSRSGKKLAALCDEHERLEAEVERLEDVVLARNAEIARGFCDQQEALTAEIKTLCNAVDGETAAELHRLEGLLRALGVAELEQRASGKNLLRVLQFQDAVYAEAVRLAKEPT